MDHDNALIAQRLQKVRQLLETWDVDALYINNPSNRRWLSNFTGSSGWLLISENQAWLATDFRYWEQAQIQAPLYSLFQLTNENTIKNLLQSSGVTRVAVESQHLTLNEFSTLQEVDEIEWFPKENIVEPLRTIKSELELVHIRRAAAITDGAMAQVPHIACPGQTERELAWELEKLMREAGADGVAFNILVASGPNAALPHHHPSNRELQPGDTIIVDMGAKVDGYCSDMTRTFFLGNSLDPQFEEVYQLVLQAQTAAIEGLQPGVTGKEADDLAREVIKAGGRGEQFGHGLGHGVGLDIHEQPRLSQRAGEEPLQAGMVTTVEPGVYVPGWGGVRIEDLVILVDSGIEFLSRCPKQPVIPLP